MELIHTCYRIGDIDRSVAFYEALGFEERRRMPIREEAINVFMGLPGDGDRLELTYNHGVDSYELGTGYNHIALTVDDLDETLERLGEKGIEPEKPPYRVREGGSRICFVRDPDGYRIELIEQAVRERRLAVVDLGSNSFRLVVFTWEPGQWFKRTDEIHETVRIGEGLDAAGVLAPEPMERALETVDLYAHFCRATGIDDVRAVATSAIRDAGNRDEFLRRAALDVQVLSTRGGGLLRLPRGGQLDHADRRRRARPRRRLDAADARRRPPGGGHALVAARRRAYDRALPGQGEGQAEAPEGAAGARGGGARRRRRG